MEPTRDEPFVGLYSDDRLLALSANIRLWYGLGKQSSLVRYGKNYGRKKKIYGTGPNIAYRYICHSYFHPSLIFVGKDRSLPLEWSPLKEVSF